MSEENILTKEIAEQLVERIRAMKLEGGELRLRTLLAKLPTTDMDLSEFTSIEGGAVDFFLEENLDRVLDNSLPLHGHPHLLTKEIAEQFLKDEDSVDLSEFKKITNPAAESLSGHKEDLHLDGLISLSDSAADSLRKKYGGEDKDIGISLTGLRELSDAAAERLSKFKGWLDLSGLITLSDAAAKSMSKSKAWFSFADSECFRPERLPPMVLSDEAAKSLAKMDPDNLELTEELEEQVAQYR